MARGEKKRKGHRSNEVEKKKKRGKREISALLLQSAVGRQEENVGAIH